MQSNLNLDNEKKLDVLKFLITENNVVSMILSAINN